MDAPVHPPSSPGVPSSPSHSPSSPSHLLIPPACLLLQFLFYVSLLPHHSSCSSSSHLFLAFPILFLRISSPLSSLFLAQPLLFGLRSFLPLSLSSFSAWIYLIRLLLYLPSPSSLLSDEALRLQVSATSSVERLASALTQRKNGRREREEGEYRTGECTNGPR